MNITFYEYNAETFAKMGSHRVKRCTTWLYGMKALLGKIEAILQVLFTGFSRKKGTAKTLFFGSTTVLYIHLNVYYYVMSPFLLLFFIICSTAYSL